MSFLLSLVLAMASTPALFHCQLPISRAVPHLPQPTSSRPSEPRQVAVLPKPVVLKADDEEGGEDKGRDNKRSHPVGPTPATRGQ